MRTPRISLTSNRHIPRSNTNTRLRISGGLAVLTAIMLASNLSGQTKETVNHHKRTVKHSSTTHAASPKQKVGNKKGRTANKKASKKTRRKKPGSAEPKMPVGYLEKSKLLLQAYQLRKRAWNEEVQENYEAAQGHLKEAIALTAQCYGNNCQELVLPYLDLASAAQSGGHLDVASSALASCLEIEPACLTAQLKLALLTLKEGKPTTAITLARQGVKTAPADPRPHFLLSLLLSHAGQNAEAHAEKEEAKRLYHLLPRVQAEQVSAIHEQPGELQQSQTTTLPPDNDQSEPDLELP